MTPASHAPTDATPDRTGGLVLVADDDRNFREMTCLLLRRHGYGCDAAGTAAEAEALLREREYDLLVSDIDMPGNHNLDLVAALPQLQAGLPVVLVTGAPSIETAAQSVGLAVAAYLIKPLQPSTFLPLVDKAVARYGCYRAAARSGERLASAAEDARGLAAALRAPLADGPDPAVAAFVDLTLRTMQQSMAELRQVLASSGGGAPPAAGPAGVPAGPASLVEALWETIAVLERTRSSFKSKELGDLRKRLEGLIGPHRAPHPALDPHRP